MENNLSELFEIIDTQVKIEDIIGRYINLEKKGNNYIGLCPFHSDNKPSLHVSPGKKIYKCFSCGAGGNSLKFIQNYENLNFIDALKKLCQYLNIDFTPYLKTKTIKVNPELEKLKQINSEAKNFYKYLLNQELKNPQSQLSLYLNKRKIEKEILGKYDLGFASKNSSLENFLIKKGFKESDILNLRLAVNSNGRLTDFFKERLIFPILDENNETIAFSGRLLQESDNYPKYLNSAETKLFNKQKTLYNLNNAKNKINLKKEVIIVEGFMDVIAYSKLGFDNVVATMGTNFTDYHFKKLKSLADNFILSFDLDQPGINTTFEVGEFLLKKSVNVKVIDFSGAKDFDEFFNNNNSKKAQETIENSKSFLNFLIKKTFQKDDLTEENIKKILKLILLIPDGIEREKLLKTMLQLNTYEFIKNLINNNYQKIINYQKIEEEKVNNNFKYDKININKINRITQKIKEEEVALLYLFLKNKNLNTNSYVFITKSLRLIYIKLQKLFNQTDFMVETINEENFSEYEEIIINQLQKLDKKFPKQKLPLSNEENKKISIEIDERINNIIFLNKLLSKEKIKLDLKSTDDEKELDWLLKKTLNE